MRITTRQLKRIIREEHEDWGMGAGEESRTRPGEEDYTGHAGDESKTHPGELDYEGGDVEHKAHTALAAIQDLASAAGVDLEPEVEGPAVALERRRRRGSKRLSERQLKRIIRSERRRLYEDSIDSELDNLKKNVADDLDHIKDLHDDIKDDHEEEVRAEKEKKRHDEALKRRLRRIVRGEHSASPQASVGIQHTHIVK